MSATTKFLQRELKALPRFVRRNGPLPEQAPATATRTPETVVLPNPFLPWRNPKTGRWAPSKYSLRQQADLIKQAKAAGKAHLLPPGVKLPHPERLAPGYVEEKKEVKVEGKKGKGKGKQVVVEAAKVAEKTAPEVKAVESTTEKPAPTTATESTAQATQPADEEEVVDPVAAAAQIRRQLKSVPKGTGMAIKWDRRPKERVVPGADIGARLYAKKKKMFKGSAHEREMPQRAWRTWILLRDMRKRIRRYRTTYVHRKANPLKPSRTTQKKLPF
ncbi:Mitoc-mL59 domain-containing protein [Mycena chlorophos]|uniref:Mitoc-mL59 domain-containing protein n=1 Tax=Mycena chlorophos TaxID=658473 RepID=A0A8H6TSX5_MYCCL|nr:Mitoc-mL59 domain-containing protein [Mycena chlorophos]